MFQNPSPTGALKISNGKISNIFKYLCKYLCKVREIQVLVISSGKVQGCLESIPAYVALAGDGYTFAG